jgi:hypothetical protein
MEMKDGFKLKMNECLIIYEELCKAAKKMGFKVCKG